MWLSLGSATGQTGIPERALRSYVAAAVDGSMPAMRPMQFISSTWQLVGRDRNGDGTASPGKPGRVFSPIEGSDHVNNVAVLLSPRPGLGL